MNVIAHIIVGFNHGGTEMHCQRLIANWTDNSKHIVIALDKTDGPMRNIFIKTANVDAVEGLNQETRHGSLYLKLRILIKRYRVTHVINHYFGIPHIISVLASRFCGVKNNIALSGNPAIGSFQYRIKCWLILFASYWLNAPIITCSNYVHETFKSISPRLLKKSKFIYYGIEIPELYDRSKRTHDQIIISMVARLDSIKDHETLIRAFALINFQNATLNIIGDGPLKKRIEGLVASFGLSSKVHLMGSRSDVNKLLCDSDIFVFSTTEREGFGIAIIEAMAYSLPIVATNVNACREVLGSKNFGLVPPGNHIKLAEAIDYLINYPKERIIYGKNNWDRAKKLFSIESSVREYSTILSD